MEDIKLKVCGMREQANIEEVASLNPGYMGFIFYAGSKRYAGNLLPETLTAIAPEIKRTGVFVNEQLDQVLEYILKYKLSAIQLHGDESPAYCAEFKALGLNTELIKAFGVDETFDFNSLEAYEGVVDYFLFDTRSPDYGGSGQLFSWRLLEKYTMDVPYFLSGGIGPESVAEIKKIRDERLFAVDVNSRFELEPGLKNVDQLKEFRNQLFQD